MKALPCPHCGESRIAASRVPKDVVAVITCPACSELVVLFRKKAMALSRDIIERGSFEDRVRHLSEIVAEFLDPSMFSGELGASGLGFAAGDDGGLDDAEMPGADEPADEPISEREVERFARVDLKRIDEAAYFRKHFG